MFFQPTDADVKVMLKDLKLDAEQAGAKTAADRLQLLQKALHKTQRLAKVLKKADSGSSSEAGSSSSSSTPDKLDPSSMAPLDSRDKLVAKEFDCEKMYSIQEKFAAAVMVSGVESSAWFELRRTLYNVIEMHVAEGVKRLHVVDNRQPHKLGGVVDFLGARVTPDGKVPLLETRHRFFSTHQVTKECAAVETRTNPPRQHDNALMELEPEEVKLMAVLFDANASRLAPSYISVQQASWGTGSHFTPSFLLPIEPLTHEVSMTKTCNVCGKEGAKACGGCRAVVYCGKECQNQDWKQHKAACKAARAAADAGSTSVVVDLQQAVPDGPYVTTLPTNTSLSNAKRMGRAGVSAARDAAGAEGVVPDPAKKFIVKVQVPMGPGGMPLFLYDQRRKVVAYINSAQQPAFSSLEAATRQQGYMGAKLYCWATLETQQQLRVFTQPLPSQIQNW